MPTYTHEQFQQDLAQLGGMIENFYSQHGGEKGDRRPLRNFKVITVNNKPYPNRNRR